MEQSTHVQLAADRLQLVRIMQVYVRATVLHQPVRTAAALTALLHAAVAAHVAAVHITHHLLALAVLTQAVAHSLVEAIAVASAVEEAAIWAVVLVVEAVVVVDRHHAAKR